MFPPDLIRDVLDPARLGDEGLAGPPVAGVAAEGPHRHAAAGHLCITTDY